MASWLLLLLLVLVAVLLDGLLVGIGVVPVGSVLG
jgi:hypothetical protein